VRAGRSCAVGVLRALLCASTVVCARKVFTFTGLFTLGSRAPSAPPMTPQGTDVDFM
jgi:hypothetical protein